MQAASAFGAAWSTLGAPRVATALANLRVAFPEWSEDERQRVCAASFANAARCVVEFALLGRIAEESLGERVEAQGIEHYAPAREASPTGGVVLITAHLGNWELLAVAMSAAGFPLSIVQRDRDDSGLGALVERHRGAGGAELLGRGNAARAALRAIKDGRLLVAPLDQNTPRNEGVFVPFFGRLACTRSGPIRIAMRTGAPVMTAFLFRKPDGRHHLVRVSPPLDLLRGKEAASDPEAIRENVARVTRVIEAAIREAPEQWTWSHRRWRTQPEGEPRPYASRRRGA